MGYKYYIKFCVTFLNLHHLEILCLGGSGSGGRRPAAGGFGAGGGRGSGGARQPARVPAAANNAPVRGQVVKDGCVNCESPVLTITGK